jgi:hypothetical protein
VEQRDRPCAAGRRLRLLLAVEDRMRMCTRNAPPFKAERMQNFFPHEEQRPSFFSSSLSPFLADGWETAIRS